MRLEIPLTSRYACRGCGACCRRGFDIHCPAADRERLARVDWPAVDSALAGGELFARARRGFRLALDADGACRFLASDHRCRMHAKLGYEAKLLACKMFPVYFRQVGRRTRVGLLYSCPAVCDGDGPALSGQRGALETLRDERDRLALAARGGAADADREIEAVRLFSRALPLDGERLERLASWEAGVAEFLREPAFPWRRRLWGAAAWVDGAGAMPREAQADARAFSAWLDDAGRRAREAAAHGIMPWVKLSAWERIGLRQLCGLIVAMWEPRAGVGGRASWQARARRAGAWWRHAVGRGGAGFPFGNARLESVWASPPDDWPDASGELLTRYVAARFEAGAYYGSASWGMPVVVGARWTTALPAAASVLARCAARAGGRDVPSYGDVRLGVMMTDNVVGHLGELSAGFWLRPAFDAIGRAGWPARVLRAALG